MVFVLFLHISLFWRFTNTSKKSKKKKSMSFHHLNAVLTLTWISEMVVVMSLSHCASSPARLTWHFLFCPCFKHVKGICLIPASYCSSHTDVGVWSLDGEEPFSQGAITPIGSSLFLFYLLVYEHLTNTCLLPTSFSRPELPRRSIRCHHVTLRLRL